MPKSAPRSRPRNGSGRARAPPLPAPGDWRTTRVGPRRQHRLPSCRPRPVPTEPPTLGETMLGDGGSPGGGRDVGHGGGARGFPDRARFAAPGNGGQGETGGVGREMLPRQSSLPPGATTPYVDVLFEGTKINHRVPAGRVLAYASATEGQKRQRRGVVSR